MITVKKDKSVNIVLDARKLIGSCIKKRPNIPNKDESLNQVSAELSKNDLDPIWLSVRDLNYAYGQLTVSNEISTENQ